MRGDVARMDKKGDKKLDADELLLMMKALGWVLPLCVTRPAESLTDAPAGLVTGTSAARPTRRT